MNNTKIWCATILVAVAMISLTVMSTVFFYVRNNISGNYVYGDEYICFSVFVCTIVVIVGIVWLFWPDIKNIWKAISIFRHQNKDKTEL